MSTANLPRLLGRTLSLGLTIAVPAATLPVVGCSDLAIEGEATFRSSSEEMVMAETIAFEHSPASPAIAKPDALSDLTNLVKSFKANGATTSNPMAALTAQTIEVVGVDGEVRTLQRTDTGLEIVGAGDGIGVHWAADFTKVAFDTPQGRVALDVEGSFDVRRELVATIAILGLGGTNDPDIHYFAAPAAAGGLVASAWPVVAVLGLVVVMWGAFCLGFQNQCFKGAEKACGTGNVQSTDVVCGGVSAHSSDGGGVPTFGFEAEALECSFVCNPPSGGDEGGDDGPLPPEGDDPFPPTNPEGDTSICPPPEEPQPCATTEGTVTFDTTGEIEEVTVDSETSFGYCCL